MKTNLSRISRSIIIIGSLMILLPSFVLALETTIFVSNSVRIIPDGMIPDPEHRAHEGGFNVLIQSNNPIDLLYPDPDLIRVDPSSYSCFFPWNWHEAKNLHFVDAENDTITVVAYPQPVFPLSQANHTIPVVHIKSDSTAFWHPDTGIYVWGNYDNFMQTGSDWERTCEFDYYNTANELMLSIPSAVRINGQYSRYSNQKGMKFYFDHTVAPPSPVAFDFFGDGVGLFNRLILRDCRAPNDFHKSELFESVFRDLGNLGSRSQLVAAYLNQEYWGCYFIRERYDEEFVEITHGHDGEDYILIKDGEAENGNLAVWNSVLASFSVPADYTSHAWFAAQCEQLDMASYIDWLFINIYATTTDNGFDRNVAQLSINGGPFRFLMWDQDGVMAPSNLEANFFNFYSSANYEEFLENFPPAFSTYTYTERLQQWMNIFHNLMQNSEFKAMFFHRVDELMTGLLSVNSLQQRLSTMQAEQSPEIDMHFMKWFGQGSGWYQNVINQSMDFIENRLPIVEAQRAEFLENFRVPVELNEFTAQSNNEQVILTWHTESEEFNTGFIISRSISTPDNMVPLVSWNDDNSLVSMGNLTTPADYSFPDITAPPGELLFYRLSHVNTSGDTTVVNWIEPTVILNFDGLVLNELQASNDETYVDEFGEADDWFEIFNNSTTDISLRNFFVTDNLNTPTMFQISGDLIVPAGGNLILWADNQPEQGANHVSFKLSSSGEQLGLFSPDGTTLIDSVEFPEQFDDHIFERFPNGTGPWTYGWAPTPNAQNIEPRVFEFLHLNEMMSSNSNSIQDESGEFEPWVEIRNPLPVEVSLAGLTLGDTFEPGETWTFPNTNIASKDFLIVWLDGDIHAGPLHATVNLQPDGGFFGLYAPDADVIDVETYPTLITNEVYARIPDGDNWEITTAATPGQANPITLDPVLVINEFLAKNDSVNQDETGSFEDWVEIYNPGDTAVNLSGFYLSDNSDLPEKWAFPAVIIEGGSFLIVWCDDDIDDGPLHTPFKLSASGEEILLSQSMGETMRTIDHISFGPQIADVSMGRIVDAGQTWQTFTTPTPGTSNNSVSSVPGTPDNLTNQLSCYPNPFNPQTTISFTVSKPGKVTVDIYDLRGRKLWPTWSESLSAGSHEISWNGTNNMGQGLNSGIYLVRMVTAEETISRRITLLK